MIVTRYLAVLCTLAFALLTLLAGLRELDLIDA